MNPTNTEKDIEHKISKRLELLGLSKKLYKECSLNLIIEKHPNLNDDLSNVGNGTDLFRILEKHKLITIEMEIEEIESIVTNLSAEKKEGTSHVRFNVSKELINEVCNKAASKWEFIGAFLCLDFEDLEKIAADIEECEERLRKVFDLKIGSDEGLNWASIKRALEHVEDNPLINKLEKKFANDTRESTFGNLEKPNWTYFMAYLSQQVSGFWMPLARQLEIDNLRIDTIKGDRTYHRFESKAFAVLKIAYGKHKEGCFTWNIVSTALKNCRKAQIAQQIESNKEFFHFTRMFYTKSIRWIEGKNVE